MTSLFIIAITLGFVWTLFGMLFVPVETFNSIDRRKYPALFEVVKVVCYLTWPVLLVYVAYRYIAEATNEFRQWLKDDD